MCIAIMNPSNVTLKKSLLKTCWENNYHGGGLLYINSRSGQLESYKSLDDFDALYAKYQEVRSKHSKSKVVLHFRISTHGTISVDNVHPFMVNKSLGFVHNGIISQAPYSKQYSDTYMFNETMLKKLPKDFINNDAILDLIDEYIGYSKLLFLDKNNNHYIVGEEKGVWDYGCWFSNTGYKASKYLDYGGNKVLKTASVVKPHTSAAATNFNGGMYTGSWSRGYGSSSYDDFYDDADDVNDLTDKDASLHANDDGKFCDYCMCSHDDAQGGLAYNDKWQAHLCVDCEWELIDDEAYDDSYAQLKKYNAEV
jgi:hypothetical protein